MYKVNKDKCIGCGACVSTCPEVFAFGDDGLAEVIAQPNEENINLANEALENCPTDAIEIVEEEKTTTN
jgi:ferredoxin